MSEAQPVMIIPIPEKEWVNLSAATKNNIIEVESRINEFAHYIYSGNPDRAIELLKRIGLEDSSPFPN